MEGINTILRIITWVLIPVCALLLWSQLQDHQLDTALRSTVAGVVAMVPEGLILLTSVAFMLGLNLAGTRFPWMSAPVLALFGFALIGGAAFLARLLTAREPLIPLSILREPRAGLSYETLLAAVEQRLSQVPRYRQKVREVTMRLARPVWIDDRDFDITYHVRRSALPSPGSGGGVGAG